MSLTHYYAILGCHVKNRFQSTLNHFFNRRWTRRNKLRIWSYIDQKPISISDKSFYDISRSHEPIRLLKCSYGLTFGRRLDILVTKTPANFRAIKNPYTQRYPSFEKLRDLTIWLNTLRPRQNGRHFAEETFKPIFLNENVRISLKISLNLFLRVQLTIFHRWFR